MQGFYKVFMYQYYTGDKSKVQRTAKAALRKNYMLLKRAGSNFKNGGSRHLYFRILNIIKVLRKKMGRFYVSSLRSYAGKKMISSEDTNLYIKNQIHEGNVFAAVRFGSSELAATVDAIEMDRATQSEVRDKTMVSLCRNAGFFPNDKILAYQYGKLQAKLAQYADLFAVWGMNMEDYIIDRFGAKSSKVCVPRGFEPYYFETPWSGELKGKKVLVIHPFEKTIQEQYKKRELLFQNPDVLPEFTLYTLKAVQSAAYAETEYDTWFDALQYMFDKAMKIDFDVAIIGCGAYGFSLACMLKQEGKTAIHMGGATQILFGIKGKRWDDHPVISKLYNEHWVRPSEEETPRKANEVEGACYW